MSPLSVRPSYLPRLRWWIRELYAPRRPSEVERDIARALRALQLLARPTWETLTSELSPEAGLTESGLLYAYRTDKAFEADQPAISLRRRRGVRLDYLSPPEIEDLEPALGERLPTRGLLVHGRLHPGPASIAHGSREPVSRPWGNVLARRRWSASKHGKTGSLRSKRATRELPVESVVLAAGAWSKPLAERLGARVPLDTERGYLAEIEDPSTRPRLPIVAAVSTRCDHPKRGWRAARRNGRARWSGRPAEVERMEPLLRAASEFLPGIAQRCHDDGCRSGPRCRTRCR